MNMSPWFHRGGLHSGGLTPTFYVGGTCVVLRECLVPNYAWNTLKNTVLLF